MLITPTTCLLASYLVLGNFWFLLTGWLSVRLPSVIVHAQAKLQSDGVPPAIPQKVARTLHIPLGKRWGKNSGIAMAIAVFES